MDEIHVICFYLHEDISDEDFQTYVHNYWGNLEYRLPDDLFSALLWTKFSSKEERITLQTQLRSFIRKHHASIERETNDAFMERFLASNQDCTNPHNIMVAAMLKKYQEPPDKTTLDCSNIQNERDLRCAIRQAFNFPANCGDSWQAMNDYWGEKPLPKKISVLGIRSFQKKHADFYTSLLTFLDKIDPQQCIVHWDKRL